MIPVIRTLRSCKDHLTVIEQQPDPPRNVTKASDIFPIHGDYEMGQQIIPTNKSLPQFFSLDKRKKERKKGRKKERKKEKKKERKEKKEKKKERKKEREKKGRKKERKK